MNLKTCFGQVFDSVRWCVRNIIEHDEQSVSLFGDAYTQDNAVVFVLTSESNVDFTNSIDADVARILVFFKSDVNLLGFGAICPVEHTRFSWVCFENTFFFTFSLDDLDDRVCLIYNHVAGLKLYDFGETEGVWQELNISHYLVHTV